MNSDRQPNLMRPRWLMAGDLQNSLTTHGRVHSGEQQVRQRQRWR